MSSANIGWLFYKDYFKEINYRDISCRTNQENIQNKVENLKNQTPTIIMQKPLGNTTFKATTTYPGLLLGSGTTHELPNIEGQAILGFHFDYTTGLPVISGSSIKGVLRSAFKYPEYIQELLEDVNIELSKEDIKELEVEIFGQENGSSKVIKGKDIFFDATITSARAGGKILEDDYITPHKNKKKKTDEEGNLLPDEIFDPIPLRFIKVASNVTFMFDFELQEDGIIKAKDKAILFAQILTDLGVGAKTNVGYGKLNISLSKLRKSFSNTPLDEALVYIENSKAVTNDLHKKLKTLLEQNEDIDKAKIFDAFDKKYHDINNKFADRIRKLLK